jgi:hypothetical protein
MARIRGAKELRASLKKMSPALKNEAMKEVEASTKRMHETARMLMGTAAIYAPLWHGGAGMQDITGAARRNYRRSILRSQMRGRVGLLTPAAERAAFYLRFFIDGTVHQPARNFHDDAFERERDVFIRNQGLALERVLRALP